MQEIVMLFVGILLVLIGFPIGKFLAKITKEELRAGQKWFKLIIVVCVIGAIISLIFRNDVFLFSFLFIASVTLGSLKSLKSLRRK